MKNTTKFLAAAAIVACAAAAPAEEVGKRFEFKGDFRYRHENIDREEASADRTRHRIRARAGVTAAINEDMKAVVRLATGGGSNDPRSTNQTLGDGFDRKDLAVDLAYVDWKPIGGVNVMLGKTPQPWVTVGSYFWDGDITPEGAALKFSHGAFFGSAFGYWLSESSSSSEATLSGAQFGLSGEMRGVRLMSAVGYYDVGAVYGKVTTAGTGCTPNGAFFGGPQGNSTFVDLAGCAALANDFNLIQALAQAEVTLVGRPLAIFVDFIQNQQADALDTGYSAGFKYGKASSPGTWEVGYAYQMMEKDAQFGQFVDSDFGDGVTDTSGSVFKFAYALAQNWVVSGTYFLNRRFVDVGTKRDYDRLQIDVVFKY